MLAIVGAQVRWDAVKMMMEVGWDDDGMIFFKGLKQETKPGVVFLFQSLLWKDMKWGEDMKKKWAGTRQVKRILTGYTRVISIHFSKASHGDVF